MTPQETEPDLPVSIRESPIEARVDSGLPQGQGHGVQQSWEVWHAGISPFAGRHYHHYPYHSLASGQTTGREQSPTHQQKIKDLLSMALPTRARSSFPHSHPSR